MHPVFKKITVELVAVVMLLSGMVLQNITSWVLLFLSASPTSCNLTDQDYRTQPAPLVDLTLTAVNINLGNMMPAFGWTSCTLTLLSATGLAAVVVTDYTLRKEQEKITRKAEKAVSRGTGRKISSRDIREWRNAVSSVSERGCSAGSENDMGSHSGGIYLSVWLWPRWDNNSCLFILSAFFLSFFLFFGAMGKFLRGCSPSIELSFLGVR